MRWPGSACCLVHIVCKPVVLTLVINLVSLPRILSALSYLHFAVFVALCTANVKAWMSVDPAKDCMFLALVAHQHIHAE